MTKLLPPALVLALVALANVTRAAAEPSTAYTALRLVGKTLGNDSMTQVVEMTGRGGTPQPETWRIVLADGGKGGREIEVAGGRVLSQATRSHVSATRPIKLDELNLDSSGAFDAVNGQARGSHVAFASLDYALHVNPATGKPVWDIDLFNNSAARVASVRLAAHDGNVIASTGLGPGQSTASTTTTTTMPSANQPPRRLASGSITDRDHDSVRPTRVPASPDGTTPTTTTTSNYETVRTGPVEQEDEPRHGADDGGSGFFARVGRTLDHTDDAIADTFSRTGHAVDRTVRRTGVKLQRFFSGDDADGRN